jgi:hypothetical protein
MNKALIVSLLLFLGVVHPVNAEVGGDPNTLPPAQCPPGTSEADVFNCSAEVTWDGWNDHNNTAYNQCRNSLPFEICLAAHPCNGELLETVQPTTSVPHVGSTHGNPGDPDQEYDLTCTSTFVCCD